MDKNISKRKIEKSGDYDELLTSILARVNLEHNYLIREESFGLELHVIEKREWKNIWNFS